MSASGVPAYEDASADALQHPSERGCAVLEANREGMLRGEPITRGDESDAGRAEGRRHEPHPLLVAGGPAAAVPEKKHPSIGLCWLEEGEPLVRVGSERF